ncbi:hypothetical protein FTO68_06295 [Methanocalculus taiwanensis]|uniref:Uncharacterized protein n=1 Tax=Methanocalculus taiwanensis TaxID=106207 RepID=A0ABD4TMT2_9EURY|nr:hypothetical protein [Methanocalculus taiwanensis]MCQ1538595.1 hypothetical protein [Methanocalculus taiwanensis]
MIPIPPLDYAAVFMSALLAGIMIGILIGITITPRLYNPTGPIAEFLNECGEIHAAGIGIIHTFTMIKPLKYSEIPAYDISPELMNDLLQEYHYYKIFFWSPRIGILMIGALKTGIIPQILMI